MKRIKIYLLLLIIITAPQLSSAANLDITTKFKFWLLNNEAKALSSISFDQQIVSRISTPLSIIPLQSEFPLKASERIWEIHRKFYVFLDEIEHVYRMAKRYGNGRFAIILQQARPEIWGVVAFNQIKAGIFSPLSQTYRKVFYDTLIKALGLDLNKDKSLSSRLKQASRELSDDEMRLFNGYLDTFTALFPSDPTARMIKTFVQTGTRREFATGIAQLIKPEMSLPSAINTGTLLTDSNTDKNLVDPDDPLAELEKLSALADSPEEHISVGETEKAASPVEASEDSYTSDTNNAISEGQTENAGHENEKPPKKLLEAPDPGVQDMFNIWE
ncbi:MAG: hypothetical protein Kow0029_17580 [Candidatus Rifleibacteriota bacterium]